MIFLEMPNNRKAAIAHFSGKEAEMDTVRGICERTGWVILSADRCCEVSGVRGTRVVIGPDPAKVVARQMALRELIRLGEEAGLYEWEDRTPPATTPREEPNDAGNQ